MSVHETAIVSARRVACRGEELAQRLTIAIGPARGHVVECSLLGRSEKRWSREHQRPAARLPTRQAYVDGPDLSAVVEKHKTKCHGCR